MSVFCTNCGAPMDDDSRFCTSCGAKMLPESEVPNSQESSQQSVDSTGTSSSGSVNPGNFNDGNLNSGSTGWGGVNQPANSGFSGSAGPTGGYGQGSYQGSNTGSGQGFNSRSGMYQGPQNGSYGGGMPPQNSGGGIPKIVFVLAGVLVIGAIVAGVLVFKGLNKDKPEDAKETTKAAVETQAETKAAINTETGESRESVKETAAPKATGDLAKINLPDGVKVKTDATLMDLVGEYKGEIQMTRMDGYEEMDDIPEEGKKAMLDTLDGPIDCELEITEDGQWSIEWPIMDSSMEFASDDYDDPRDFTESEIEAMHISGIDNGVYHAKIEKEGEIDDGSTGRMTLHHIGAYCTDGSERLIAGNFYANIVMQGMDVTIEGDFVVKKTTEDIAKEELEDTDSSKKKKDTKETEEETEEEIKDFKGNVDSDSLGKKADALAKKQDKEKETEAETKVEIPTVSGGKWKQVGSEWMYEKNKKLVKNSWILHKNVYYYVDENGFMLTNGYTPDGYYVGKDGAWDQKKSKYDTANGSDKGDELSEAEQREIAEDLSTSEDAHALEFDWFYDYVLNKGRDNGRVITDKNLARRITDEQAALNGGWKAFMFTKDGDYGSDGERYFNATVDTKGNKFYVTLNWHHYLDPTSGKTVTETGNDLFRGTYDDLEGTAVCRSDYGMIEFNEFYISTDGLTEYAIGTFHWISGEIDQIALARGVL
ncbi:zinc-ribbon domain-containing protein [Oribacterium sp. P6A1]|uniref:zinc-ribbon domain-containing protein n=1 Tax=Oribacterium sp. P6A1 TaxID=1410612 RepID=UPI000569CD2D|nr:zinc-ribbon domain-containing protein [Oribacterium sp. P6A1]